MSRGRSVSLVVRWYAGQGAGGAEAETGAEQLGGELRMTPEAVDDPLYCGPVATPGGDELVCSAYVVYYERLACLLGEARMKVEETALHLGRAAAQPVETTLANCNHSRVTGGSDEGTQPPERDRPVGAPRMYTHRVCAAGQQRCAGLDTDDGVAVEGARGVVGMHVGIAAQVGHGAGS